MNEKFFLLSKDKQQRILNAGFRVFSQNSYRKSPMSEIADAAGISKSLLFHYFRNKAEFLLSHPISRTKVIAEKFCAIVAQLAMLNVAVIVVTALSVLLIEEKAPVGTLALLFLAYFLMQLEVAAVTFGISAFLNRGSLGLGLGLAALFYFLNIIANLTEDAAFLKYLTPFGYTDGADIISDGALHIGYVTVGLAVGIMGVALAFWWYRKKDIA